jgi:hypothetical protein
VLLIPMLNPVMRGCGVFTSRRIVGATGWDARSPNVL